MASNNQRAPSAPPPPRWSKENKKNSKEPQKLILAQVKEMFASILDPDVILSVVQNCKWKLQPSIDALIMLSENVEVPLNQGNQNSIQSSDVTSSSNLRMSKSLNREGYSMEEIYQEKTDHKSNLEQKAGTLRAGTNSYLNLNDRELQRQQEEFRRFELLKKDLTEKGFVQMENENLSKPCYSQEQSKIPHPKQFGGVWSTEKSDPSRVVFCSDVENSPSTHLNSTTNQVWANENSVSHKQVKETNSQFDQLFGSKLQFSRHLQNNKIGNKGTIPKNSKTQANVDPAIISACNAVPKSSIVSSTKGSEEEDSALQDFKGYGQNSVSLHNPAAFSLDLEESKVQQQQVEQFNSNYDNESKTRARGSKPSFHKVETESLCGLKVQYRLPGMENSSDDDADVVIEEESTDYPTQIPSLMSINVCQFISSSTQSPPQNTHPEIFVTDTRSLSRSPQHNTFDNKMKNVTSSILNGYKVLVILRGLAGSGKTHLANNIVRSTVDGDRNQFIFSSDDYFVMLGRGMYQYVRSKLSEAHNFNQKKACNAMREGLSPIIIDNTNSQSWEMRPYVAAGVQNGYIVEVLEPNTPWSKNVNELARKNVHRVPKDSIKKMLDRYEENITGDKLIEQFSLKYSMNNLPPQIRRFPFFGTMNEGREKSEKQKASGNKSRNRRKKKNSGTNNENALLVQNTSPMNHLLSESDKSMKHQKNSPRSNNQENTLDKIVSNALKSENDTLNKSLVDYCIATDSGDELDSDRVPLLQENGVGDETRFDLLGDGFNGEKNNSISSSATEESVQYRSESEPKDSQSSDSGSPAYSSVKKISNTLQHQNLGAIGSERKGSVTALDCENFERTIEKMELKPQENVLSQCWDFTLLVNGRQIHSTMPPRKIENDLEHESSKPDSEHSTAVIITEIADERNLNQFLGDGLKPEDPEAVITKIINKMDASEHEKNPGMKIGAFDDSKSTSEAHSAREDAGSSFGLIFNMIKKSFLGKGSEEKPISQKTSSAESILKFENPTNNNSLSEKQVFANETCHKETSATDILDDEKPSQDFTTSNASITIAGDSLSEMLSGLSSYPTSNSDKDLCQVSKPVIIDTLQSNMDLDFRVDDTLSGKFKNEKGEVVKISESIESRLESWSLDQIKNHCIYSNTDSHQTLLKNADEKFGLINNEEDDCDIRKVDDNKNRLEIDLGDLRIHDVVEKVDVLTEPRHFLQEDEAKTKNADLVHDILTEAMNRVIARQDTENKSQTGVEDNRMSLFDEGNSESSQIQSSHSNLRSVTVNLESETGLESEVLEFLNNEKESLSKSVNPELKNDNELVQKAKRYDEIVSEVEWNLEMKSETNPGKVSDLYISTENIRNGLEHDSSMDERCECQEDCESKVMPDTKCIENAGNENLDGGAVAEIEKTVNKGEIENKTPEIIDNINQITWRESPFTVPVDSINSLLEMTKKVSSNVISKSDSSTNTSHYDFNVLYLGGTSEPEYKILRTTSRTIYSGPSLSFPEKPQLKLMLDKSSMTNVVDILSGEENLEFKTENEMMKSLEELIEMFPNVSDEDITEIYETICSCNFNWAVDMLLDGVPEQVIKYGKIEAPKITLVERQASVLSDPIDPESQTSTPRRERLDKLKQQSSSSESNDSDSKLQQQNSTLRKKKDRHKVSEETLELKRQIEEKMIINEACYNPHILKVKRWRNGEPDIAQDFKEKTSQLISSENEEFLRDTQSPKSFDSNDDFTDDDIDPEEMMELNLGEDFIKILENQFGNPEFQFPGGLFPVIQIKKSMAQQIHALWIESMEQQLVAQQEQLDKMIEKDAEYARSLEQEEARSLSESLIPNLTEIMDMEMALAIYRNDLKKQRESETPNDMASRLSRQMLHDMFTNNDPETLDEILKAHNGDFKETVTVLEASTGQIADCTNTLEKQKSLIDSAQRESLQSDQEQKPASIIVVNPELGQSSNPNCVSLTYDAAIEEADVSRKEAQRQLLLRNENFNKAKEAIRKGNPAIAGYYSQMAKLHAKKREWANSSAASAYLAAQDYRMDKENTLDLHYLYVAEALEALDVFLDHKILSLNEGNKKSITLYIITGRGARSSNGLSRLKPAVSKKLASKNIRFMDANPGCLKVIINRRNTALG